VVGRADWPSIDEPCEHVLGCGNRVMALHDGAQCFPALHAAIDAARSEVLLEMYWFESDSAGESLCSRLIRAARRGVVVRVVYDAFGSIDANKEMFDRMRAAGCEVLEYNPIGELRRYWRMDRITRRDHRKMLVVDRRVAFTGGMNIGDFWLPREAGGEGWRDVMVRIEGPVVVALAQIFERLVGPLRLGHDDRGNVGADGADLELLGGSGERERERESLGGLGSGSGLWVLASPSPDPWWRWLSLDNLRDRVAASVDKGRDALSDSLFARLSRLPEGTMLLFPHALHAAASGPAKYGTATATATATATVTATAPLALALALAGAPASVATRPAIGNNTAAPLTASEAWWSAQGRLRLNWRPSQGPLAAAAAASKGWLSRRLRLEQVKAQWQTLGSNVQIITNDALAERNTIRRGYLRAINAARERITIANSYFVPCKSIRRALYRAAERGVDVRIIVPGSKTDLHSVRFATHYMYDRMLSKGVKLYEYLPTVLHAKVCVIDAQVSTLGTYNLDYRSWYYNLEVVAVIHDGAFAEELERRMQRDIETNCEKVELGAWSNRPWFRKLLERFFFTLRRHM
jgi:phosphatidylserine/phosphatidylglycerophosphate/cardiolipin synthase-like enzyme